MQNTNLKTHQALWDEFDLNPNAAIFQENDAPRLVVDDQGNLVFANNAFLALAQIDYIEATSLHALFANNNALKDVREGRALTYSQNNFQATFDIDSFTTSKRDTVYILSTKELNTAEKLHHYVSSVVDEKQNQKSTKDIFLDIIHDACIICRPNGNIIDTNAAFTQMFGHAKPQENFGNIFDYIAPDYIQEFKEKFHSDTANEKVKTYHRDQNHKWLEWNFSFIENNIYAIARDISERQQSKTELAIQQVRLKEAEAIGHFGQWEWFIGQDNIIFSEQLFKIFGLDASQDRPTLDSINDMIHEDDKDRMMQVFQRAIIECNNYDMDFCIQTATGKTRYIRCEGRCKTDEDNDVYALYGIMQDVTDIMQREQDLLHAKESVERAYAAKTQFLANMSHELRTPLNAVIGFSEMMERQLLGPIGNEKYLEYISGIRKSGEHLLDLISDILDMSKIEAGKYDLHLEKFNLAKTARLAVHMIEGRAVNNNIKLDVQIREEDLPFVGDRRAIMQVILNLLSNSVKFSRNDGVVTLAIDKTGDEFINIKVIDQGIGIPANKLATITQPFEQVESHYTREYEGTGLGLSITKELIQLHDGSLDIQSRVNEGTTVSIILPIRS